MTRVLRRQFPRCNPVVLVAVALAGSLSACGTVRQVEQFKELSNQQRYAEVAAQEVQCQPNTNVRLLSTAEDFLQAEPGHLAATYFINSARLAQFQLDPQKLQESSSACATLNELLVDLEVVQPRAASSPYEVSYKRLRLDITGLKRAVPGCK